MAKILAKRLLALMLTVLLVSVLAFLAFSVIPGDPTTAILGTEATDAQVAALRQKLGLDLPLHLRYLRWLGGYSHGDLGTSYQFSVPVRALLAPRLPVTLTMAAMALGMIICISLPVSLFAARFSGGVIDRVLTVLNQVLMSVPGFLLGIGLTYLFGLVLHWFVPGGYVPPENGIGPYLGYLLFPALALALPKTAMTVKMLRGSLVSELGEAYVRTSYSRGAGKAWALWRHALRNALIPTVTFLASMVVDLIAGAIVVEQVFAVPGIGQLLVSSVGNRDYPVVQAIILMSALTVVLCNFFADMLYRVIDPRLRRNDA